jgi:hypothetical protein
LRRVSASQFSYNANGSNRGVDTPSTPPGVQAWRLQQQQQQAPPTHVTQGRALGRAVTQGRSSVSPRGTGM